MACFGKAKGSKDEEAEVKKCLKKRDSDAKVCDQIIGHCRTSVANSTINPDRCETVCMELYPHDTPRDRAARRGCMARCLALVGPGGCDRLKDFCEHPDNRLSKAACLAIHDAICLNSSARD
jgi:hypothetical protein